MGLNREVGRSSMKANLQKAWGKKGEHVCQGVLDLADAVLEDLGFERLRETHWESLHTVIGRIIKLAQLTEGFEMKPSEAEQIEIARENPLSQLKYGPL